MNWKRRIYGIVAAFFYGYSAGFPVALGGAIVGAQTDLTFYNIFTYPVLSGIAVALPKISKTFQNLERGRK